MSTKRGDGLTGYTLPNGYALGPWERHGLDVDARARYWRKCGAPKELAAVARRASWSIHRHVEGWAYDNSGGCASAKDGREIVDILLRGVTERMDRAATDPIWCVTFRNLLGPDEGPEHFRREYAAPTADAAFGAARAWANEQGDCEAVEVEPTYQEDGT